MDEKKLKWHHLLEDALAVAVSIAGAFLLVMSGMIPRILDSAGSLKYVGSFIIGIFFTSAFTIAPATAAFFEISKFESIYWMAFFGGLGALFGDFVIFRFAKDRLTEDIKFVSSLAKGERFAHIFHRKIFRWVVPFVAALIIASPFPDEIGIIMLGLVHVKGKKFAVISYFLNTAGILAIGLFTRNFLKF